MIKLTDLIREIKPPLYDQRRTAYKKAVKDKDAEAMSYYQLLRNHSANVPFEQFKGSWAYEEWLKKPEVVSQIENNKNELKRFNYMGESNTIRNENEQGLTEVDNWKITDADYLTDMGFTTDGMYHFGLKKPEITVCHKKGAGFFVEDKTKKESKTFLKFKELMEYFSQYQQRFENEPYK